MMRVQMRGNGSHPLQIQSEARDGPEPVLEPEEAVGTPIHSSQLFSSRPQAIHHPDQGTHLSPVGCEISGYLHLAGNRET